MPTKKNIYFKVFLVDFRDVRAPVGYTSDFVNELIFSSNPRSRSPKPDMSRFAGSAHQYFHAASDFWFSIKGGTTQWAKSNMRNRDIPHYRNSMVKPEDTSAAKTDYGESWPVIVAEALRSLGFVSSNYRNKSELQHAILRLPGGRRAERLIFLNVDVAGGGVKREFSQLKGQLDKMSDDKVRANTIPGRTQRWNTLWDDGWAGLPMFFSTPIITARQSGTQQRSNGTYPGPNRLHKDYALGATSVLWHEMGHLGVDITRQWAINDGRLPDFYRSQYGPWGKMCLMGGPRVSTQFPMPLSSLAKWMAGWLDYRDYSRADHVLKLRPYETHNDAIRITNGAPGTKHYLCFTNRDHLVYPSSRSEKPSSQGRGVLGYRLDLGGSRLRINRSDTVIRKFSSLVRKEDSEDTNHLLWSPGNTIGANPPSGKFFSGVRTLRNERGELWYTLEEIKQTNNDLKIDLKLQAMHLLEDYHLAKWYGEASRKVALALTPDEYDGPSGHVALQDKRMRVAGRGGKALYLHPRWEASGSIKGIYDISHLQDGPKRLYLKLGMPDEAYGTNGTRISFKCGTDTYSLNLNRGDYREVIIDFRNPYDKLYVTVTNRGSSTRDWVYIMDGWLVPAAPRAYDFLAEARRATWRTGSGRLTFNRQGSSSGEASLRGWMHLHTKKSHGTKILFTHPNWHNNGWIEGTYPPIRVPKDGAMIRAHIGWQEGRHVTSNGVTISVSMIVNKKSTVLISDAKLDLYKTNAGRPWEKNEMMYLELPIPSSAWDKNAIFKFRVKTDGSAAQDWVAWTEMALTTA